MTNTSVTATPSKIKPADSGPEPLLAIFADHPDSKAAGGRAPDARHNRTLTLLQVASFIKNSNSNNARRQADLRKLIAAGDLDEYRRIKGNHALAATYSGYADNGRRLKAGTGFHHSGYLLVEIDSIGKTLDIDAAAELRQAAALLPPVRMAYISTSAAGIHIVIQVDPPPADANQHEAAWRVAADYIDSMLKRPVTGVDSTPDRSRLAYLPHDAGVVYKPVAQPLDWQQAASAAAARRMVSAASKAAKTPNQDDSAFQAAADYVAAHLPPAGSSTYPNLFLPACTAAYFYWGESRARAWADSTARGPDAAATITWSILEAPNNPVGVMVSVAKELGYQPPSRTPITPPAAAKNGAHPAQPLNLYGGPAGSDPIRQSPLADAQRVLELTPSQFSTWDGPGGEHDFAVIHPRFSTYTVISEELAKPAAGLSTAIWAARKLDGSDVSFKAGMHTDSPKHYIDVQNSLPHAINRVDAKRIRQEQDAPRHYAKSPILCFKDSGGIDMLSGSLLTPEQIKDRYIETPPWPAVRRPDSRVYQRVQQADQYYIDIDYNAQNEAVITPADGGSWADVAAYLWAQFPDLPELVAYMLQGERREIAEVLVETSKAGKSTVAELTQNALGKGVGKREANNILANRGKSDFDDLQRCLSQHFLLWIDEIGKAGPVPAGVITESTANAFEPRVKYQKAVLMPRRGNLMLLGDEDGITTDRDAQGVKERLSILAHYKGAMDKIDESTRKALLGSSAAADYTACLIFDAIRQGKAGVAAWMRSAAEDRAENDDPVKQALQAAFIDAPGEFTPSSDVTGVINQAISEHKLTALNGGGVRRKIIAVFPEADNAMGPDKSGKRVRGWIGIAAATP